MNQLDYVRLKLRRSLNWNFSLNIFFSCLRLISFFFTICLSMQFALLCSFSSSSSSASELSISRLMVCSLTGNLASIVGLGNWFINDNCSAGKEDVGVISTMIELHCCWRMWELFPPRLPHIEQWHLGFQVESR